MNGCQGNFFTLHKNALVDHICLQEAICGLLFSTRDAHNVQIFKLCFMLLNVFFHCRGIYGFLLLLLQLQAGIFIELQQHSGPCDREQLPAVHGRKTSLGRRNNLRKDIQGGREWPQPHWWPEEEHKELADSCLYPGWTRDLSGAWHLATCFRVQFFGRFVSSLLPTSLKEACKSFFWKVFESLKNFSCIWYCKLFHIYYLWKSFFFFFLSSNRGRVT